MIVRKNSEKSDGKRLKLYVKATKQLVGTETLRDPIDIYGDNKKLTPANVMSKCTR